MDDDQPLAFLVVEDEALIAMTVMDMIEDMGHRVIASAATTAKAIDLIARHRGRIDACILDANLGGASSAPVADALREAGIPFLVASGYDGDQLRHLGFKEVALAKPFRRRDLTSALGGLRR